MDVLSVLLLTVVLILVILDKISVSDKLNNLEHRLIELQNLLRQRDAQSKLAESARPEVTPIMPPPVAAPVAEPPQPAEVKPAEPPKPIEVQLPERPKPVELPPETVVERHQEVIRETTPLISRPVKAWEPPVRRPVEPQPSFFERYPDLEKFIGENLVNKIGIAILVLAIGFFVKYAIDQQWIGPVGRVGIGIFCGAILVGFAHRLRKNYKAFSSVLAGGGIAVFYFSITLAFQQFHLLSQLAALCIMVVITVFAVALSLLYDKQELAVIALIGGMASPFLLSNGTANYDGLFVYLLVLNTGLLIIAYYKAWRILNISSFALSVIVVGTLIYSLTTSNYYTGLRYASIFYLLFFTINIINNIRENKTFLAIDFSILLVNTALYFGAGLYLLTQMGQAEYRGLFCASLGFINLVLSYILFRKKTVDTNILYLLIGITLTFISLTAPIQLHGNNITLFWTCETVLLYWLYQKSGIGLMKLTSLILWLLMIISLCMDLEKIYVYNNIPLAVIANKGFITTVFSAIGSYVLSLLVKRDREPDTYGMGINAGFYSVMALILLFLAGGLEINHQFAYYYPTTSLNLLYLALYVPVFIGVFHFLSARGTTSNWILSVNQVLLACTIGVYLVLSKTYFEQLEQLLTQKGISVVHFAVHWMSDVVIVILFYQLISLCRARLNEAQQATANWLISAAVVTFLSLELCLVYETVFYSKTSPIDHLQTVYIKAVLPILWGVTSFALMWLGMRNKQRNLRIISLTLFTITLLKLFLFDIVDIPVGGKIAAFFCLGVLLLIVSFMYQKVKKIITDDAKKPKDE